jgi:hypothetical protein
LFAVLAGCGGAASRRRYMAIEAATTECRSHGCASEPPARDLGDGCYVVNHHLYDCEIQPGGASCFEIPRCPGACTVTIEQNGLDVPIQRCLDRWDDDRRAHLPPPTCDPVRLVIVRTSAPRSARSLMLPAALVMTVFRSGKDMLEYSAVVCGGLVGEPTHRTGFPEIDDALRVQLELGGPGSDSCEPVSVVVSHFECTSEMTLD